MKFAAGIVCFVFALTGAALAQDTSSAYTKPYQQKALEIYRTIIAMRTAEGQAKTPEMAEYLAGQLRDGGFSDDDIHLLPFTDTSDPTTALVVRYRGDGSSGKKPILLVGHMDVVDALREDWERDPFTLIEEDGYFFGRGTMDNKAGIATLTATFLRFKAEGYTPKRDLIIAFTADEETDMITTEALVTKYRTLTDAEFALNSDAGGGSLDDEGEAVSYLMQAAEKTYATFELTVRNPGGHSSMPRSDNAIYSLAAGLMRLSGYRFPVRSIDLTRAYFKEMAKVTPGALGEAMRRFAEDPSDEEAAEILWNEPSQVGVTRTTCIATMLRAGHAENALPQSAVATVNCRIFPGVEVDTVKQALQEVVADESIAITVLDDPKASPASPLRDDVTAALTKAVHARHPGIPVIPYMAPYATDGKELRRAGIPTYGVSGMFMKRDEIFAHGLNERLLVKSFFGELEHWNVMLKELAG